MPTKTLVIVESPSKAVKIGEFLGPTYRVFATMGHLMSLPAKGFGVRGATSMHETGAAIKGDFDTAYAPATKRQEKMARALCDAAEDARAIIIATDGDREGAAIGFHAMSILGAKARNGTVKRAVFFEITRTAVRDAVANPIALDHDLYHAQKARRLIDRSIGYLVSPLVRKHVIGGVSAGRCQSVALARVVERHAKAVAATPGVAFHYEVRLGGAWAGLKMPVRPADPAVESESFASALSLSLVAARTVVMGARMSRVTLSPKPSFTTSSLLQAAGAAGVRPARTMATLQKLYTDGHITYHRTDSTSLSPSFADDAAKMVAAILGPTSIARRVHARGRAGPLGQEAHEAIRPTRANVAAIAGTGVAKQLYEMIWRRAVSTQACDAVTEVLRINCRHSGAGAVRGGILLGTSTATLRRTVVRGFRAIGRGRENGGAVATENDSACPSSCVGPVVWAGAAALVEGDVLGPVVAAIARQQTAGVSAPLFSEASLIGELEGLGVGRPSTYSTIVGALTARKYARVSDSKGQELSLVTLRAEHGDVVCRRSVKQVSCGSYRRKLVPTSAGEATHAYLSEHVPCLTDTAATSSFTSRIERTLDSVASGSLCWRDAVRDIWHALAPVAFAENRRGVKNNPSPAEKRRRVKNNETPALPRVIGVDPVSGRTIYAYAGRYGPVVRVGEARGEDAGARFVPIPRSCGGVDVAKDDAMFLISLPRILRAGRPSVELCYGRHGFYVKRGRVTRTLENQTLAGARAISSSVAAALIETAPAARYAAAGKNTKRARRKVKGKRKNEKNGGRKKVGRKIGGRKVSSKPVE